jgi:hypothetical protein
MTKKFSAALRLSASPLLCVLLSASSPHGVASAQDAGGDPANWRRNGAFASDSKEFKLARVRGSRGVRAYFYGECGGVNVTFDGVYRKKL